MPHHINHNIKFWIAYKRYTYQDVADMLDTTLGRIKTYVGGVAVPPAEMLMKIADMMNVSLDTLFRTKLTAKNYGKEETRIVEIEKKLNHLLAHKK